MRGKGAAWTSWAGSLLAVALTVGPIAFALCLFDWAFVNEYSGPEIDFLLVFGVLFAGGFVGVCLERLRRDEPAGRRIRGRWSQSPSLTTLLVVGCAGGVVIGSHLWRSIPAASSTLELTVAACLLGTLAGLVVKATHVLVVHVVRSD